MNRLRSRPASRVAQFACAGIAAALVAAGCSSGTAASVPTGGGGRGGGRGGRGGGGGVQPVVTATVSQKDVPLNIAAVGNVEAYTTISVRS